MKLLVSQHILGPVHVIDLPVREEHSVLSTYVVKGPESMVIDPGTTHGLPGIVEGIREIGIKDLRYIGLTHVHLEQAGGAWKLSETYPEAELLIHPDGIERMIELDKLDSSRSHEDQVKIFGEVRGVKIMRILESKEGTIDLGGLNLKVVYTPGHDSSCQCFFDPDTRILIVGDSVGVFSKERNIITPDSPSPFNPRKTIESLEKLIALRPEIICLSHSGFSFDAVKRLILYREQISLWDSIVTAAVKEGINFNQTFYQVFEADPFLRMAVEGSEARVRIAMLNMMGFIDNAKRIFEKHA